MSEQPTQEDLASDQEVGVDKEALHQFNFSTWSGITTDPQPRQGLHCLTLGIFGAHPTSPDAITCTTLAGTNNLGARCVVQDGGTYNNVETRVTMPSGSSPTGSVLVNGSPASLTLHYNVTSSNPKSYAIQLGTTIYTCDISCVPGGGCAGLQVLWTAP